MAASEKLRKLETAMEAEDDVNDELLHAIREGGEFEGISDPKTLNSMWNTAAEKKRKKVRKHMVLEEHAKQEQEQKQEQQKEKKQQQPPRSPHAAGM